MGAILKTGSRGMWEVLLESVEITALVFVFMLLVELVELRLGHAIKKYLTSKPAVQYVASAVLGLIPGCNDAFVVVTMYISGIVSFGALVTVMITTFGDEAFVLFSALADPGMGIRPGQIFALCAILFVVGIGGGLLADALARRLPLHLAPKCVIPHHDEEDAAPQVPLEALPHRARLPARLPPAHPLALPLDARVSAGPPPAGGALPAHPAHPGQPRRGWS